MGLNYYTAFFAVLVLGFGACANPEKVVLSGPVTVEASTASKADASCWVENCSAHGIRLLSAKFTLHYPTENMATVMLAEPVVIAKCWTGQVVFPLRIRFANPLMALTAANLESLDWENLYVTGEGVVRSGLGKRKIRLNNYPVREFIANFGSGGVIFAE